MLWYYIHVIRKPRQYTPLVFKYSQGSKRELAMVEALTKPGQDPAAPLKLGK